MRNNKIFIIAHGARGGGVETYLRGLLPELLECMGNIEFIMTIAESRVDKYQNMGKNLSLLPIPDHVVESTAKRVEFDNFKLAKICKSYQPSIVIASGEIVPASLKKLSIPIVLVYHATMQFYMKPSNENSSLKLLYTRMMRKRSAKIASTIVAVSHYERAEIGMWYPKFRFENSCVIYHGVNRNLFYPRTQSESYESLYPYSYIVSVSDFHRHKKISDMILIYRKLRDLGIKEHLLIIGRIKEKDVYVEFCQQIEKLDLLDYVHILDYVDNSKLRDIYINAKLYWTNSNYESFGLTPLEAMACRIPVAAPWRETFPEIYGDSVYFYNPFTECVDQIAEGLYNLLTDSEKLELYANIGYRKAQKFTWEKAAGEYKKLFERYLTNENIDC